MALFGYIFPSFFFAPSFLSFLSFPVSGGGGGYRLLFPIAFWVGGGGGGGNVPPVPPQPGYAAAM